MQENKTVPTLILLMIEKATMITLFHLCKCWITKKHIVLQT